MLEIKEVFGLIAVILFIISYIPYFRDLYKHKTKPHPYSWTAWALIWTIITFIQYEEGGGAGIWGSAIISILSLTVAVIGWKRIQDVKPTILDLLSFIASGIALFLWLKTDNPLLAVILLTSVDMLGYIPTIRKTWKEPFSENMTLYIIGGFGLIFNLLALSVLNFITALEPFMVLVMNIIFVSIISWKRKKSIKNTQTT